MGENNLFDGFLKARSILGDVTNQRMKRGFTSVSGCLKLKSEDGFTKNVDAEDEDYNFAKKICFGVENLVKEKCGKKCAIDDNDKGIARLKTASFASTALKEVKETSDARNDTSASGCTRKHIIDEIGDAYRDSCVSADSDTTNSVMGDKDSYNVGGKCQGNEGRISSNFATINVVSEDLVDQVDKNDVREVGSGRLASSKCGPAEWLKLPTTQGARPFELERCLERKESCANLNAAHDTLKNCSCSFCLKASYIWSDLHYQDIKGRMSALKKSQREASALVQRSCRGKEAELHGLQNSSKSSKLESDLLSQWRSLFLHTEDIFLREGGQLQAGSTVLKNLRENCKTDLEVMNRMSFGKD